MVGERIPRLTTLRYKPKLSIALSNGTLKYFAHHDKEFRPNWRFLLPLLWEWLAIWAVFWFRVILRLPLVTRKLLRQHDYRVS